MPSKRLMRPLKPIRRFPPPQTEAQNRFLARRARELEAANASTRQILAELTQGGEAEEVPPEPLPEEEMNDPPDNDEDEYVADLQNPPPEYDGDSDDDCIEAMRIARYQAKRLEEENRWKDHCLLMLPRFLRCRYLTSDWGNNQTWNHDFKEPCTCRNFRWRAVDLIDILTRDKKNIQFCECKSDQVRLVELGYIGASPLFPKTAFSIRLLRLHQQLWLNCGVSTQGFCRAIDTFLNAHNPLLLTAKSGQKSVKPRDLRAQLGSSIKAFRTICTLIRQLEHDRLGMTELDLLASNCPRCFGPPVSETQDGEPDIILCVDGNFQHRRHAAASVPIPGYTPKVPELFLEPTRVEAMADALANMPNVPASDHEVHPCTEAHTAANDVRGKSHWGGCDDTGLIGMVCRHDHLVRFINVVQSGEKSYFALSMIHWMLQLLANGRDHTNKLGIMYDIGCNLEKGIIKRDQFRVERAAGRLKFATSLWHSYAHNWGCQLDYNPRLNTGWGMTDGEGTERNWSDLDPLVPQNRYATKDNRLQNLNQKSLHHNDLRRYHALVSLDRRGAEVRKRLAEALRILTKLRQRKPNLDNTYLSHQWDRQKQMQATAISESAQDRRERLTVLLQLEEELLEARQKLEDLRAKRARTRTQEERHELLRLPNSLVVLEERIEDVAKELGTAEFMNLNGTSDVRAKALLTIQLAKSQLYDAKVGVIEHWRKAKTTHGASRQARVNHLRKTKTALLKKKYATYCRHANRYNESYEPNVLLRVPVFLEVCEMDITDAFWNTGSISHPNEPWATDPDTQAGIQAHLTQRRAEEELCRMGREVRHLTHWALDHHSRVERSKPQEGDGEHHSELWMTPGWNYVITVPDADFELVKWDFKIEGVLKWSAQYVEGREISDADLLRRWNIMIQGCEAEWKLIVGITSLVAEEEDDEADMAQEEDVF